MSSALPANTALPAISAKLDREVVELGLLEGVDSEALNALFVAFWMEDRFRVTLDCAHVDHLGPQEARTLARFRNEFSCRGGFVRLTRVNDRVRSVLEVLHCADLLAPAGSGGESSVGGTSTTRHARIQ